MTAPARSAVADLHFGVVEGGIARIAERGDEFVGSLFDDIASGHAQESDGLVGVGCAFGDVAVRDNGLM